MNYWLAQLLSALGGQVLAARNSDDKGTGWMQILIFVILAVFYAVGSIVKAKANKTALKEEKQIPRKPGTKPLESVRAPKAFKKTPYQAVQRPVGRTPRSQPRPQVQPPRRKVVRPQPAGWKPPTKTEEAIELPTFEPLEVSKVAALEPQVQPKFEELPEFTAEAVKKLGDKRAAMPAEKQPAKYLSEIWLDYDDPERLRRAILHYEILGKPLSLRDPSAHIIGL